MRWCTRGRAASFRVVGPNARRGGRWVGDCQAVGWPASRDAPAPRTGIWEIFVPGHRRRDASTEYEIIGRRRRLLPLKSDPVGFGAELRPSTASSCRHHGFAWTDDAWMTAARCSEARHSRFRFTKVHLGSWRRGPGGRWLTYGRDGGVAGLVRGGDGIHARGTDAGHRASARRVVGLPAHRALCADVALRRPRGVRALRGPVPRHAALRDRGLVPAHFPVGSRTGWRASTAPRSTSMRIHASVSIPTGIPRSSTSGGARW